MTIQKVNDLIDNFVHECSAPHGPADDYPAGFDPAAPGDAVPAAVRVAAGRSIPERMALRARSEAGREKYGVLLYPGWRSALRAAVQEALDLCVYLEADNESIDLERYHADNLLRLLTHRMLAKLDKA
jgi:hypothetical protein